MNLKNLLKVSYTKTVREIKIYTQSEVFDHVTSILYSHN